MPTPLLVLLALIALGLVYEAWARRRDRRRWPAPGQRVDVGGHHLHARVFGSGPLTVVFEADEGAWSTHWGTLPERLATSARVIAYDRAGLGWSDTGPAPRDSETLARELHQLLRRLAPDAGRRTVIVAHGTGAHVARMYAHRYPFETQGLVLVDGYPDTLIDRLRREQLRPPVAPPWASVVQTLMARLGLLRLMNLRGSSNDGLPLPERSRRLLDALELDPRVQAGAAEELAAEGRTLEQLARLREAGDVPFSVLVAGETLAVERVPRTFPREEYNRLWAEEGAKLARGSTCATVRRIEGADHLLQLRAVDAVEQATRALLADPGAEAADPTPDPHVSQRLGSLRAVPPARPEQPTKARPIDGDDPFAHDGPATDSTLPGANQPRRAPDARPS